MGSTVGLCPPQFPVEDGGTYKFNKFQRWLWQCWQAMLDDVKSFKPDVLIINGDEIQGAHDWDGQLWTNKPVIQCEAAIECLGPLCDLVETRYFVRGTPWHVGKVSEDIEAMARLLGARENPETGRPTWPELYLDIGGPVMHVRHKISVTSIPYYEASAVTRDLLILLGELSRFYGQRGPNLKIIVRSHRHRALHVSPPPGLHGIVTAGWQLKTEYGLQRTISQGLPQIGYTLLEWDGSDLLVRQRDFPLPKPHVESLR